MAGRAGRDRRGEHPQLLDLSATAGCCSPTSSTSATTSRPTWRAMAADPIDPGVVDAHRRDAGPVSGTRARLLVVDPARGLPHRRSAAGHRRQQTSVSRSPTGVSSACRWRTSVSLRNALTNRFRSPSGARSWASRPGCERDEAGDDLADRAARDLDLLGAAGRGAQRRRDADRAHASPPQPALERREARAG